MILNERLERLANELECSVYKDAMHGKIAKDNFVYGVAHGEIELADIVKKMEERFSEQNRKASDENAPTDRIAYLAGKRDAMTELLQIMKEDYKGIKNN